VKSEIKPQPKGTVWLHGRVHERSPRYDVAYELSEGVTNNEFLDVVLIAIATHYLENQEVGLTDEGFATGVMDLLHRRIKKLRGDLK
jgi:hypothetical protein